MLSDAHFYFKLLRKYVIAFGNMFNRVSFVRYDVNNAEIQRLIVPLVYAPKDKMVTRYLSDPELDRPVSSILPRMSFEIVGDLQYDAARKQNSLLRVASSELSSRVSSQYMGVPYNIIFDVNVYAKNIDDGNQIIEQILPYFNPDYTVTINPVPETGVLKDVAIILNKVSPAIVYEGDFNSVRYVNWTLSFTLKGYFFGPVSNPKIIRKVFANIFNDPSLRAGYLIRLNTEAGNNGTFKLTDTVYQGTDMKAATAFGFVNDWSPVSGKLVIGAAQGQFTVNSTIRAASTNASYNIASFDANPLKLVEIKIEPDPLDADPDDDFGYTTTITEYPDIQ